MMVCFCGVVGRVWSVSEFSLENLLINISIFNWWRAPPIQCFFLPSCLYWFQALMLHICLDFLCIHVQIPLLHHLQVAIVLWDLSVSWILLLWLWLWLLLWWWWWWLLIQNHSPPKETCLGDYPVNKLKALWSS